MTSPPTRTLAVVGLGQMGGGMAATLVRAGEARVLGVDPIAAPPPGVESASLAEAMDVADALLLSLPGAEQVEEILQAVLDTGTTGRTVIDTSTCDPAGSRARADRARAAGHRYVDAPVSGGPSGARRGALTVFLGCPEDALADVRAVLAPLSTRINHVGDVGAGHTAKLLNNLLCALHLCAARTVLEVAGASDIDPDRLLGAINTASGRSAVTEVNLPRWVLSGDFDSGFPIGLMARDVDLAAAMTRELQADTPVVEATLGMWQELTGALDPTLDFNRMVQP
ncbi:MAG: NAD(P)-dependent oxidoreductase [Brachybacterium sp.]|nr:NAD(P)-dependent oxidoreductase [Brachybacterium sp.]